MSDEPHAASPAEVAKAIKALRPLSSGYAYSWAVRDVLDEIESLRSRLESAEELTALKQGIIEAADTRIRELASRLESAERERDGLREADDIRAGYCRQLQIEMACREPIRLTQVPDGCWVACIAGLTDIPHEELAALIPRGVGFEDKACEYHNAVNTLTRSRGWRIVHTGPDVPSGYAIASGKSPRGLEHAVIVKDGELWHDPHPTRAGLLAYEQYEVVIRLDRPATVFAQSPSNQGKTNG